MFHRTRTILSSIALLALSLPASADSGPLTDADCRAVTDFASKVVVADGARFELTYDRLEDGVCVFSDVNLSVGGFYSTGLIADGLRVEGDGVRWILAYATATEMGGYEAAAKIDILPERLVIKLDNVRGVPQMNDPAFDYMMRVQSRLNDMDAVIDLGWDRNARRLDINTIDVSMFNDNLVRLSGKVENVDLSSFNNMVMSASGFAVTELDTEIRSFGLFQIYVLPMFVNALITDETKTPEAQAEVYRQKALKLVDTLPTDSFPDDSKQALRDLITDLPEPWGVLKAEFRADPGFGPVRFSRFALTGGPESAADLLPLAQGTRFEIDWTRQTPPWQAEE